MALTLTGSNRYDGAAESGRRMFYGTITLGSTFAAAGQPFGPADLPSFTDPVTSAVVSPKFQRFDSVQFSGPIAYNGTTTANCLTLGWDPATGLLQATVSNATTGIVTAVSSTTDFTLSKFNVLVVGN